MKDVINDQQWKLFMQDIKVAIFDLDGTLYEDTAHFAYYAELLKSKVPSSQQHQFEQDYAAMLQGKHPVAIGRVFDVQKDIILEVDPMTNKVKKGWSWKGQEISCDELHKWYVQPLSYNFETMIAIGDGWWLPNACAKHYGVKDTYTPYNQTKEYMASEHFQLTRIPQLRESILRINKKIKTVLVTNSDAEDVERLLERLDLLNVLELVITLAEKPKRTKEHFQEIIAKYRVQPNEVVSIGDNYLNEIAPAEALGMKAIYIHSGNQELADDGHARNNSYFQIGSISDIVRYIMKYSDFRKQ